MDDATSSPTDSTSTATLTPLASNAEKSFTNKPRRLARGLNDLFARQSAHHKPATPSALTTAPAAEAAAMTDGLKGLPVAVSLPAAAAATGPIDAGTQPALAATKTEPAAAATNAFEYRFVQLISRLDATCNLMADARQTHLAAAQRSGRIAWGVAGALAVVAGICLWWAGSIAAWNRSQFEYESMRAAALEQNLSKLTAQHAVVAAGSETITRQHDALTQQHATLAKQNEAVRAEVDTIRRALARANAVIDELMTKPEQR
jgi:hypothetical protein